MKRVMTTAAVLTAALAVTGVALGTGELEHGHRTQARGALLPATAPAQQQTGNTVTSADQAAPSEPLSGSSCPAQVNGPFALVSSVTSVVSRSCGPNSALVEFAIAGKANAATGSAAAQRAGDLTAHPASYLRLVESFPTPGGLPGWKTLPAALVDDDTVAITQASLASGITARVTDPIHDNGLVRVEWIQNGTYYQLLSDRGWTPDGTTGLPAATVVEMAKTLT